MAIVKRRFTRSPKFEIEYGFRNNLMILKIRKKLYVSKPKAMRVDAMKKRCETMALKIM
jgi:hypothetical protein